MKTKLAALFSDHMVLQRGIAVPVWGWAGAGDRITVRFAGQSRSARADRTGKWQVSLASLKASGEPRDMIVSSKAEETEVILRDIVVGDVWVCSGQSNMEWPLSAAQQAVEETAAAVYPNMRLFTVPRIATLCPAEDIRGSWARCTPASAGPFSAVGYFFGRELHRKTGVPIGLINASWAEPWPRPGRGVRNWNPFRSCGGCSGSTRAN